MRTNHRTVDLTISELVHGVQGGRIGVPDFQRDFVWEPAQVLDLLDSVSNGWPIGSLLVLRGPQPFDLKPIDGGPELHADMVDLYLLDGQQRVTALFHALTDAGDTVYYAEPDDLDDDGQQKLRWERRDRFVKRSDLSRVFRLSELWNERVFRKRILAEPSAVRARLETFREEVMGALLQREYSIPAIVMDNDIDLEALTRIFETLNRTGVKLDAFDLMVAVMRRADFLLRRRWEEAREEQPRFKATKVEGVELLKLIALWQREDPLESARPPARRVKGVRQRDVLNIPPGSVIVHWDRAVRAYDRALEFLDREAGVYERDGVPSWAMLLPLAYYLDRRVGLNVLRTWYWRSVASQAYSQGANTQVTSDIDAMNNGSLPPAKQARIALSLALNDSVSRNKILKLGIRGIAKRTRQLDVLDGSILDGPLVEISIARAVEGALAAPRAEPLLEVGLTTPRALAHARSELRRTREVTLDLSGLLSQGFSENSPLEQSTRERTFMSWFEEWL